jgi:hypothetical protein
MKRAHTLLCVGLLVCASCTPRAVTEVVLEIQTRYAVPTALDGVRIEATRTVATSCASGACVVLECEPGFAHCDTNMRNGCETRLDTRADCGACATRCTSGTNCELVARSYACR